MHPSVLVVEDDSAIRDLLQYTFERAMEIVRERVPTVAVIDWMLPAMSGLALVEKLRRDPRTAAIPLLMVTARDGEQERVTGLDAGADDYVTKPFSPGELIARVNAMIRRRAPEYSSGRLSAGPIVLDTDTRGVEVDGKTVSLRHVEFRLLKLFLAHPNRVFTRNELLDRVWGESVFVEERTVDVHIRRVRLALGPGFRDLIHTVRGGGYKLDLGAEPAAAGMPAPAAAGS